MQISTLSECFYFLLIEQMGQNTNEDGVQMSLSGVTWQQQQQHQNSDNEILDRKL